MLSELIDIKLRDKNTEDEIKRVTNIGLLCVQSTAARRPTMSNVLSMLLGNRELEPVFRGSEVDIEQLLANVHSGNLTPVDEDSPLLIGLPSATSTTSAFIELSKVYPR